MHYFWSKFLVIFLVCEVAIFGVVYYFGSQGIVYLNEIKHQRKVIAQNVRDLESEVVDLEHKVEQWSEDSFLHEKYAREKLHLQKDKEIIYFK